MSKRQLVIISGISGSGKSTALNAFEDMGYFCVENLPVPLLAQFAELLCSGSPGAERTGETSTSWTQPGQYALLVNLRDTGEFRWIKSAIERLRGADVDVSLLFLDCQDEVVIRRYSETRRPHPLLLAEHTAETISEALARERELLADFRGAANRIVDTTSCSPHELRRTIEEYCEHRTKLDVTLVSFGYKYGVPHDADLLVDVRFLANPHFVRELRPFTGLDPRVCDYVFDCPDAEEFIGHYLNTLDFLLPRYEREGKHYLTIGVGCTGGRHRSIAVTMRLKEELEKRGITASVRHRDIDRI